MKNRVVIFLFFLISTVAFINSSSLAMKRNLIKPIHVGSNLGIRLTLTPELLEQIFLYLLDFDNNEEAIKNSFNQIGEFDLTCKYFKNFAIPYLFSNETFTNKDTHQRGVNAALKYAAKTKQLKYLKFIIQYFKNKIKGYHADLALDSAIKSDHLECCELIMQEFKNSISKNVANNFIKSAARKGKLKLLKLIIQHLNNRFSEEAATTALIIAAKNKHSECANLLDKFLKSKF